MKKLEQILNLLKLVVVVYMFFWYGWKVGLLGLFLATTIKLNITDKSKNH